MNVRLATILVLLFGAVLEFHSTEAKRRKPRPPSLSSVGLVSSKGSGHRLTSSQGSRHSSNSGSRNRRASCPSVNYTCPASFSTPPLILIAMDGFRMDYLERGLTPTLQRLGTQCGLKARHMRPAFPTTTYPNLYTIVTGLFPESHGLIDNNIYDPTLGQRLDRDLNWNNSIWWQKDPIWVTAERQHKTTASFFWIGSDVAVNGVRPSHFRAYNPQTTWTHRIRTVLDWLDMPAATRPKFITLYFNQPDNDGHRYGPDSQQVNSTLSSLDSTIAQLVNGLEQRRILGCVNVMIVSDHGMIGKSCNHVIPLDQYLDLNSVYYITGAASRLRPKGRYNSSTVDALVNRLRCQTDKLLVAKKEDLPKRFHFSAHDRIEPVVLGPTPGWVVRRDTPSSPTESTCSGGTHGYDNMAPEMKALFIAFGPAFKRNITVAPFANIELYNLMTDLIGITAEPNNGTRGSLHHLMTHPPALPSTVENGSCSAMPTNPQSGRTNTSCLCQGITPPAASSSNSPSHHLIWGSPGCASTQLVNQKSVVGHSAGQSLPTWTAFTVTSNQTTPTTNSTSLNSNQTASTSGCWTLDPRLSTGGKCYSGNATLSPLAPSDSAIRLISSASPMYPGFASGAYGHLTRLINQWSSSGPINVITGPAFDYSGKGISVTAASRPNLELPSHYFVVLTRCSRPGVTQLSSCSTSDLSTLAFLLPHKETRENCLAPRPYLLYHAARIRDVEYLTGLRFFRDVEPRESARLRTMLPEELWT